MLRVGWDDDQLAVFGPVRHPWRVEVAPGPVPSFLDLEVVPRLARTTDDAELAWWQEVIGACA